MNLPKGPDTLCFDKDEFMKVHAWALLPGAGRGWPALLGPPGPLLGLLLRASWAVPAPDGSSAGTSLHFAVSLLASGGLGAAWRKHSCEIVHIE